MGEMTSETGIAHECIKYSRNHKLPIHFIIEDNKLKHGKFVPGVKIPIIAKEDLNKKYSCVLVLAWNFFEEIRKKNKKISDNFINIKELES